MDDDSDIMFDSLAKSRFENMHLHREAVLQDYVNREPLSPLPAASSKRQSYLHEIPRGESNEYLKEARIVQIMREKWEGIINDKKRVSKIDFSKISSYMKALSFNDPQDVRKSEVSRAAAKRNTLFNAKPIVCNNYPGDVTTGHRKQSHDASTQVEDFQIQLSYNNDEFVIHGVGNKDASINSPANTKKSVLTQCNCCNCNCKDVVLTEQKEYNHRLSGETPVFHKKKSSLALPPPLPAPIEVDQTTLSDNNVTTEYTRSNFQYEDESQGKTTRGSLFIPPLPFMEENIIEESQPENKSLNIRLSTTVTNEETSLQHHQQSSSDSLKGGRLSREVRKFHVCEACDKLIQPGDGHVEVINGFLFAWHNNCFLCNVCKRQLSSFDYGVLETTPYCLEHYMMAAHVPQCEACGDYILDETYTSAGGMAWHKDHFKCEKCHNPIVDEYYVVVDSRPYCFRCHAKDYPKTCESCEKKILSDELFVQSGEHFWHANDSCLCCDTCGKSLVGVSLFFRKGGKLYCNRYCASGRSIIEF